MTENTDNGGTSSGNPLPHFVNVLTSPAETFSALKSRTLFIYPLIAIIFVQVAVILYYYQIVDFPWFVQQVASSFPEDTPQQDIDLYVQYQEGMGARVSGIIGAVTVSIALPIVLLIYAGYLSLISHARGDGIKFKQWYGFSCWMLVPTLLAGIASFISIALSDDGRIAQQDINPLNLNSLFFNLKVGEPGANFWSAVDLTAIWCMVLAAIGYRTWTGKKTTSSTIIALTPFLLFYGISAAISFS